MLLLDSVLGPKGHQPWSDSRSEGIAHRCLGDRIPGCLGWAHPERCPRRQPKERGGERERERERKRKKVEEIKTGT